MAAAHHTKHVNDVTKKRPITPASDRFKGFPIQREKKAAEIGIMTAVSPIQTRSFHS